MSGLLRQVLYGHLHLSYTSAPREPGTQSRPRACSGRRVVPRRGIIGRIAASVLFCFAPKILSCTEQDKMLNLAYTIGSFCMGSTACLWGFLLDKWGLRNVRLVIKYVDLTQSVYGALVW
ncbi:hypothetical protein LAZ67_4000658 [Cordylochernes scorpioides]|uniref:Uncharacterized protein n=1 Tax=Cordylochernes scorpioides TaxID=51811 RepID=A0ABY6KCR5_9ARAC|nr:hypothetical protein LAZ67_4000658 [Cordylochernes scorpioides]